MDVKSDFLDGDLSQEISMEQPPSFVTFSNLFCSFKKSHYGLKKDSWAWHTKIDNFFLWIGFKRCEYDRNLYVLHTNGDTLIIDVYVHELLIIGNNIGLILRSKKQLA